MLLDLPLDEQPREKLLQHGASQLSDAELIAIFLRCGFKGCSAIHLARMMLKSFGGIRQLLHAKSQEFCNFKGLGIAKYVQFQAALEISRRYLSQEIEQTAVMDCPDTVRKYLIHCLSAKEHEVFFCLYLDNQHRLIKSEELFRGTIDQASVHPREIVRQAIKYNAAAVLVAHNHPSGLQSPSQSDIQITKIIKSALQLLDIRLLDHFIIAGNHAVSLAQLGHV